MMEKEARTNKAGADLDKRNRNWKKLDGAVIVESGTNENGRYIKFGDGTMICFINSRQTKTVGGGGQFSWVYPSTFIDKNVSIACHGNSVNQSYFFVLQNTGTTTSEAVMAARTATSGVSAGTSIDVNMIAIGRWK